MKGLDALNLLALLVALALSAYGGSLSSGRGMPTPETAPELEDDLAPERSADGTLVLRDAGGTTVPLVRYDRIVSGTMVADRVLADLCEPTRIVAFTRHGASGTSGHRFVGKPTIGSRASVEEVLALKPDLLVVNNLVDPGYVARLRERGVRVFDLGHMRGLETLLPNIRAIGHLIGAPERATAYARALENRLARVAEGRDPKRGPRALYVSAYGDKLYGGAARTSYHDVLVSAGLRDAAAEAGLDGWPELTGEQILALRPDVIVTKVGMGAVLCRHAGLDGLPACRKSGGIVELDGPLIDDPGPSMLEAAEALNDSIWPKR